MGASIAWHLAKAGVRDVVIVDRASAPAAGSTGRATGGFRAQFATPVNVQLSLRSREKLLRFEEDTGVDPGYQPVGYLWLAYDDSHLEGIRMAHAVQHAQGLTESRAIGPEDVREIN